MIPRLPSGFTHPTLTGEGAFSSVYRVRQTSLDRWVAMKIITEKDKTRREDLLLEAKTQANIHLDCIPQIYDTFEWDKRICIVMQWIKGVSLREILDNNPTLVQRHYIANTLIRTIAALHDQGFAHRDLKPENVLISPEHGLYLVDFGFTKSINDSRKSVSGVIKGTPAYMAPELWNFSSSVNPLRTDLYSLGKILKELFPSEANLTSLIKNLLDDNPNNRPESARLFYDEWSIVTKAASAGCSWKQISGTLSSQRHSRKLLTAAKELLFANRYDESYWLLVECLDDDPEYDDAIDFMSKFPKSLKNKRVRLLTFISIFIAIVTIVLSFLAGMVSTQKVVLKSSEITSSHKEKSQTISIQKKTTNVSTINFMREDTSKSISLKGKLFIINIPAGGNLLLDEIEIDRNVAIQGIESIFGDHILVYKNTTGRILWKEKFKILPFQKKYFSIQ